ncbi:MAG: hypothetical protein M1274_09025 [Actinobacteria bacterium]|nr:hypothetical protein [Actinomycetota bacterium]
MRLDGTDFLPTKPALSRTAVIKHNGLQLFFILALVHIYVTFSFLVLGVAPPRRRYRVSETEGIRRLDLRRRVSLLEAAQ